MHTEICQVGTLPDHDAVPHAVFIGAAVLCVHTKIPVPDFFVCQYLLLVFPDAVPEFNQEQIIEWINYISQSIEILIFNVIDQASAAL